MKHNRPSSPGFWDTRYAAEEYAYGRSPNVFLATQLDELQPGKILLPCDGEGRNAVYAAGLGWEVIAFDQSSRGKDKADALAQDAGVDIDFRVMDVADMQFAESAFNAIGLTYVHFPPDLREWFHKQCIAYLKPGGTLILEAFSTEQLGNPSGGPRAKPILYDPKDLSQDFALLDIALLHKEEIILDEGLYHQGPASVVRLVGKKPS